jgi:hypothetical protein
LLRRLGEGGMGSVYLADSPTGRTVALKVIRADLTEQPEFRRRFRSEVARAQQVPPFCTAEVLDADPDHETPFLVVEFVDGPSLSEVVLDRGPLTPANLYGLAIGVATALCAIHGAGVIHRDLKPSNVLLAPGTPKVIDFGIARAVEGSDGDTRTDQLIGTVAYMAPERLDPGLARPLTSAADVFAWGAIVAFAATGRVPFLGESSPATAVAILTQEPALDGISGPLRDLVALALAKNPDDRPTARQLLDWLLSTGQRAGAEVHPSNAVLAEQAGLSTGASRAQVDITVQMSAIVDVDERDNDEPDDGEDVVLVPRRSWRVVGLAALVVVVLASAVTVAGIATGYIRLPAVTSAAAGPPSPPAPTPSTQFHNLIKTDLRTPTVGGWHDVSDARLGTCDVGADGLTVKIPNNQTYRCPGQAVTVADFRLKVNVTLLNAGACAGIWFRFDNQQGYALQICQDTMRIVTHGERITTLYSDPLAAPILLGASMTVEVDAVGQKLAFFENGAPAFSFYNSTYHSGHVVLGAFEETDAALLERPKIPFQVRFDAITVDQIVP